LHLISEDDFLKESLMQIKNWSKFQHFRDRKPPWIKLYRDILDDREWHNLEPKAAKTLVMLWVIASEDDGRLPDEETLAFRLRLSIQQLRNDISRLDHWLVRDDIDLISSEYQHDALERETEKETEREANKLPKATRLPEDWMPSADDLAFMAKERPDLNPQHVIFSFKAYWLEKKGRDAEKRDWSRAFKNWVLREKRGNAVQVQVSSPSNMNDLNRRAT
jgi:hypothetical protein